MSMFFAGRTHQRVKAVSLTLLAFVVVAAVLAALFPQNVGTFLESLRWWLVGIPIGLAVWLGLEWCGTTILSFGFWQRMPSASRVLLLVVIIVLFIVVAMFTKQVAYAFKQGFRLDRSTAGYATVILQIRVRRCVPLTAYVVRPTGRFYTS
jgi:Na+/proline symporter